MSINTILANLVAACVACAAVVCWVHVASTLISMLGIFVGLLAIMLATGPLLVGGVVVTGAAWAVTSAAVGDRAERGIAKVKSFFAR